MKKEKTDPENVFIDLLEGRIPDRADGIKPEIYAELLIEAISFHEDRINEALQGKACHAEYLDCLREFIEEDLLEGRGPLEDDLMLAKQLPSEIAFCQEQYCAARTMMNRCESELLRLLEKYPELKGK